MSEGDRNGLLVALCTIPTDRARAFAASLVEERLAACVNVLPPMRSIYRWQGAVVDEEESQLVIKTTEAQWDALARFVQDRHGYEVPELIALDVSRALPGYAGWLREQTR